MTLGDLGLVGQNKLIDGNENVELKLYFFSSLKLHGEVKMSFSCALKIRGQQGPAHGFGLSQHNTYNASEAQDTFRSRWVYCTCPCFFHCPKSRYNPSAFHVWKWVLECWSVICPTSQDILEGFINIQKTIKYIIASCCCTQLIFFRNSEIVSPGIGSLPLATRLIQNGPDKQGPRSKTGVNQNLTSTWGLD